MKKIIESKVCFVVGLYGEEVNGGAEKHCKTLAEKVAERGYDVEVLTSTFDNYTSFKPHYKVGESIINNVLVRRFNSLPHHPKAYKKAYKNSKYGRILRRFLFRLNILNLIANKWPIWGLAKQEEEKLLKANGLYSPELINYVRDHHDEYKVIIMISYPCPNFYFINKIVPEKSILVPTAHDEGNFFRPYLTDLFIKVNHIAFNTEAEQKLCKGIFGKHMSASSILAVGLDIEPPAPLQIIQEKFNLPQRYILYFGRIAKEKIGDLLKWFLYYKATHADNVKLVLTGGIFMDKIQHPDVIYTGFVSEAEKTALIESATLIVNPSDRESLSLLLLEAMALGKPVLVNGKSEVLKQHCIQSDFASQYYTSKNDFLQKLDYFLSEKVEIHEIERKAKSYVNKHYAWDVVLDRFDQILQNQN